MPLETITIVTRHASDLKTQVVYWEKNKGSPNLSVGEVKGTRTRNCTSALINHYTCAVTNHDVTKHISFQECLAETKDKRVLSRKEWFKLICLRILTNFISIALIACATYLIVEVVAGYPVEVIT
jgi:hypothetical protein